jgi:hypothetical protein
MASVEREIKKGFHGRAPERALTTPRPAPPPRAARGVDARPDQAGRLLPKNHGTATDRQAGTAVEHGRTSRSAGRHEDGAARAKLPAVRSGDPRSPATGEMKIVTIPTPRDPPDSSLASAAGKARWRRYGRAHRASNTAPPPERQRPPGQEGRSSPPRSRPGLGQNLSDRAPDTPRLHAWHAVRRAACSLPSTRTDCARSPCARGSNPVARVRGFARLGSALFVAGNLRPRSKTEFFLRTESERSSPSPSATR